MGTETWPSLFSSRTSMLFLTRGMNLTLRGETLPRPRPCQIEGNFDRKNRLKCSVNLEGRRYNGPTFEQDPR